VQRFFPGWIVVAGCFALLCVGSGFAFYAQGVFLDALVDEQGFSVGLAGAGTGVFFVVSGISGYFAGGLIGRFDVRAVMLVGATVASLGIYLLGEVRTEPQMFGVFVIYGGGYALVGLVPTSSVVTRWFHAKRSIALAFASTGLSVGGIAITPVIARLIADRSLVELAPRLALTFWLTVVFFVIVLVRPSPEAAGWKPDGGRLESPDHPEGVGNSQHQAHGAVPRAATETPGVAYADAVRTPYFRLLSVAFVLVMTSQVGALQHLFKLTADDFGKESAANALIVVSATSVVARIIGGIVASRVRLVPLCATLILVQALGVTVIATAPSYQVLLLGVVILGASIGNLLMLHPLLLADTFGVRDYPRIYGLGSLIMIVGTGFGPFIVGVLRDATSYSTAFYTMAVVATMGFAMLVLSGRFQASATPSVAR